MRHRLRIFLLVAALALTPTARSDAEYERAVIDGVTHDGVTAQVDLPPSQHVANRDASRDGLGLCVFASIEMSGHWHHLKKLDGLILKIHYGLAWPAKVDTVLRYYDPALNYVQYIGRDPSILDRALANRIPACVTYGYGERYDNQTISHVVLLVHLDGSRAAIIDPNFPGGYEWMTRGEFLRRWTHFSGAGWAIVLVEPPAPPRVVRPAPPSRTRSTGPRLPSNASPGRGPANYGVKVDAIPDADEMARGPFTLAARYEFRGADAPRSSRSARKPQLTIIGSDVDSASVLDDLDRDPSLARYRGRIWVQSYKDGEWAVGADRGFSRRGNPSIVLQKGEGDVLWGADDYAAGAHGLADVLDGNDIPDAHDEIRSPPLEEGVTLATMSYVVGCLSGFGVFMLVRMLGRTGR